MSSRRSCGQATSIAGFNRYILPNWEDRIFVELKRSDIAALLDMIEDKHGARQADVVLTTLRSIASWVQARNDDYASPLTAA